MDNSELDFEKLFQDSKQSIVSRAFESLKSEENTGEVVITQTLNFDDLIDHFRNERFESTSFPVHSILLLSH